MAVFDYLEQYSTFQSVEDMDKSMENHMAEHYFNLTESERAIVLMLASRSLAYPGACHLKADTIATKLNISAKTVYRAVKKLSDLGIIQKVTTIRDKKGGQGANVYVILPYVPGQMSDRQNDEKPSESNVCPPQSENQPSNSFNLKNNLLNNTYATQPAQDDTDKLLVTKEQTPYQRLKSFVNNFVSDNDLTYKLYGIVLAHTKKLINKPDIELAIEAVKHTMRAYKSKPLRSITGYFNNTYSNILDKWIEAEIWACREEYAVENNGDLENWLEW